MRRGLCTCLSLSLSTLAAVAAAQGGEEEEPEVLHQVFQPATSPGLPNKGVTIHTFDQDAFLSNLNTGTGSSSTFHASTKRTSEPATFFNASTPPPSPSSSGGLVTGRYGHAAVYLPSQNQVLFIGGQIGSRGLYITNDVLSYNLSASSRSLSSSHHHSFAVPPDDSGSTTSTDSRRPRRPNPALLPDLSANLPPNAWAAAAYEGQKDDDGGGGAVWMYGGVTQDCTNDAAAYVLNLNDSLWTAVENVSSVTHRAASPPRRRQAQAVHMLDTATTYIFGGIAEPHTCSLDTVAYLAMDVWAYPVDSTTNATGKGDSTRSHPTIDHIVQTLPFYLSGIKSNGSHYEPAVSDYAAVPLSGRDGIVYIGGQTAGGELVPMDEVLYFNTTLQEWRRKVG